MTVQTHTGTAWESRAEALAAGRGADAPEWVRDLRSRGLARFAEVGFPGRRDEEWRFTNVARIANGEFATAPEAPALPTAGDLARFDFPGLAGPTLVFVDGRFAPTLSRIGDLPAGVTVSTLAEAWATHPGLVQSHLGRLAAPDDESFAALNAAFLEDGVFVRAERGVVWRDPVRALFVSTTGSEALMAHPRNLFVVEEGAEAHLVEDWVSLGEGSALTNAVTEVVVGENARAHHYVLERENSESFAVSTVHAEQARDSFFASHSALIGGALVRNNVYPTLAGEGCDSLLNGLYVPNGTQHHDTHMIVRHAAPHGDSRQFYRGILDDRGHAVFSGRIIVHEGAQKTDAKQTDMNLLLSDDAIVDTKPQLEIYADDVKCTHGATVGQLDADAIFYLRARGIPEERARGLLIYAFVNEVLERMELAPIRDGLAALLAARLPGTRA